MKTKLALVFTVFYNWAIGQQNNSVPAGLVLSTPVQKDTLYSENLISVDKGATFSPARNYTVIAGEKIVLNNGVYTAPDKGYTHQFLIKPVLSSASKTNNNPKPARNEKNSGITNVRELIVEPNPSSGIFNLVLHGNNKSVKKLTVYDRIGMLVFSDSFSGAEKYQFDISNKPAGIYIVVVNESENIYRGKIILK